MSRRTHRTESKFHTIVIAQFDHPSRCVASVGRGVVLKTHTDVIDVIQSCTNTNIYSEMANNCMTYLRSADDMKMTVDELASEIDKEKNSLLAAGDSVSHQSDMLTMSDVMSD